MWNLLRSSSHSLRGRPPASQFVRAYSRRWSKKRLLSSACCSGRMVEAMNWSMEARWATRSGGYSKFMLVVAGHTGDGADGRCI